MQDLRETENMKDVHNPVLDNMEIERALKDVYDSIRQDIRQQVQVETKDFGLTNRIMEIISKNI